MGDDDFIIDRRRKNERFRQLEEERRERQLRKQQQQAADTTGSTNDNKKEDAVVNSTATATATATTDDNDHPEFMRKSKQQPQQFKPHPFYTNSKLTTTTMKGVSFLDDINNNNRTTASTSTRNIPNGVGYMNMKSSPSSSITMSQTPEKKLQQQQQQQQQHSMSHHRNNHPTTITANATSNTNSMYRHRIPKISTLVDSDTDDSVMEEAEDLMELALRLERERAERNNNKNNNNRTAMSQQLHSPNDTITTAKRKLSVYDCNSDTGSCYHCDNDNDEEEDLVAIAQRLDQQRNAATSIKPIRAGQPTVTVVPQQKANVASAQQQQPRNPLTLMRKEELAFDKNSTNTGTSTVTGGVSRNLFLSGTKKNLLWSDSDDDTFGRINSTMTTTTKKTKTTGSIRSKQEKYQSKTAVATKIPSEHRVVHTTTITKEQEVVLNGDYDHDDDLQNQLKPHFDHPKFGPYNPPVPFALGPSNTTTSTYNDCSSSVADHDDNNNNNESTSSDADDINYKVPASINRYLPDYQRAGIEFMYRCGILTGGGAILGDDMGLGKTVQTISLLTAMFRKSGTDLDLEELKRRQKLVEVNIESTQREKERALMEGRIYRNDGVDNEFLKQLALPEWCPILIIAPNSVVTNWVEDFKTWAHFSVAVYQGAERASALEKVENGIAEILVCGDSTIQGVDSFNALDSATVKWKIIVVDEFHKFKNESKHLATNLRRMRDRHGCVVLGLTGTLMQNNHKELWNLVDIVAKDFLGPWAQFEDEYAKSIQLSRTKDASNEAVELGHRKAVELSTKLQSVYFRRTKEDTLADVLPTKDERIIFCELSTLQKELYKYIIELPDYIVLRHKNTPCDCGVNQKFFLEYQHLQNQEDKIEYQRKNRDKITTRGKCCYTYPKDDGGSGVDPKAVLWRQQHPDDQKCSKCPSCTLFGAMNILYKLCSHSSLLQVKTHPDRLVSGSDPHTEALRQLERAKCFIPPHLISSIPGGYYFENSIMDDHFALSGKMAVLDKLLQAINAQQGRVLLFAHSTKSLDLIESYILSMGKYSHLRMDGQTANAKRKEIADKFRASSEIFVLLLSTKAMGLGLNLTEANFVIMFDVDWNPSSDSQAQDRAYRIGQQRNVKVFRLVARGTIEEQKYLRQVYKTQLKSETIVDVKNLDRRKSSRLFRGVAGDENRKGELFGSENLLKFKDGTFMNYASRMIESRRYGVGVYGTDDLLETVKDLSEEELDDIGQEGNIFGDIANCTQANDSDCDEDANLGGMSQAVMEVCEQRDGSDGNIYNRASIPEETESELKSVRSNETQSPLYDALFVPQLTEVENVAVSCDGKNINDTAKECGIQSIVISKSSNDVVKKSLIRNTKIAGKTTDQIRRGEVSATTFKVSDLFIPGTIRRR